MTGNHKLLITIGAAQNVSEADLARAYRSQVDPRLNAEQALELAMLIARRAGVKRRVGRAVDPGER